MYSFLLILTCLSVDAPAAPAPIAPDYAMDSDPLLTDLSVIKAYSDKYLPLWLQALGRPEADLQRLAAETVAQAHLDGTPKMDQAKPALIRIVSTKETHPSARFTAARALIVLEAKEAAPQLWQAGQAHGADLRQLVEPALARWKHPPAYEAWRKRLTTADSSHRDLMLAIRCLGDARDLPALPQLLAIALDSRRVDAERLAAARAAGQIQDNGREEDAGKLARPEGTMIDRLCAAALLQRHSSDAARTILLALAADPQPSVAVSAFSRLNAIDFSLALPLAEKSLQNPDSGVRREAVRAYAAVPTLERIQSIGKLLDDPHPSVRGLIREEFRRLAGDPRYGDAVRRSAVEALAAESWRGQEQAALLLAALDHKPAAPRLLKLLDSPRGEVMIASAWALRKLALPETLPVMLERASHLTDVRRRQQNFDSLDFEVAHLFEAMGLMKYQPAEPLMKRYIEKSIPMGEYSRSAAIWALGKLHAGQPDEALGSAIVGRVTEPFTGFPPEAMRVRHAGAIALGTMKSKSQAGQLRAFSRQTGGNKLYLAIRWSLKEISGEELPMPGPLAVSKGGWFLEPLDAFDRDAPK